MLLVMTIVLTANIHSAIDCANSAKLLKRRVLVLDEGTVEV